jgi:hypothetical protein
MDSLVRRFIWPLRYLPTRHSHHAVSGYGLLSENFVHANNDRVGDPGSVIERFANNDGHAANSDVHIQHMDCLTTWEARGDTWPLVK